MPPLVHRAWAECPKVPEVSLVAAILHQAVLDLSPTAPPKEQNASRLLFADGGGWLTFFCDLAGLETELVQAMARARYPARAPSAPLFLPHTQRSFYGNCSGIPGG